jgi:hypothetical protein
VKNNLTSLASGRDKASPLLKALALMEKIMRLIPAIIIISIFMLAATKLYAAESTIRLICKYSHTINDEGKSSGTSGEDLITIHYSENGVAVIKKQGQGLGAEFIGTITEEQIYGEKNIKLQILFSVKV